MENAPKVVDINEYGLDKPIWAKVYDGQDVTCFYTANELILACVNMSYNIPLHIVNGSKLVKRKLDYRVIYCHNAAYEEEQLCGVSDETVAKINKLFDEINELSSRLWTLDKDVVIDPRSLMYLYEEQMKLSNRELKQDLKRWLEDDLSNYTDNALMLLRDGLETKYGNLQLKVKSDGKNSD